MPVQNRLENMAYIAKTQIFLFSHKPMGMAAFYLTFYSHQRTNIGFPHLPSTSLAGHVQVLGKVAQSYSTAFPSAPQSNPLWLSKAEAAVWSREQPGHSSSWLAERARLINRDSSAPLLIMQELSVSGGVPQQKLHWFCISDTACAGVMGIHADKAVWVFVIRKERRGAEPRGTSRTGGRKASSVPVSASAGTSLIADESALVPRSSLEKARVGQPVLHYPVFIHSTVGRGDWHTMVLLPPVSSFRMISLKPSLWSSHLCQHRSNCSWGQTHMKLLSPSSIVAHIKDGADV